MPLDTFDFIKLFLGIIIFIIPGYLWSYIFSKEFRIFERIVFGFIFGFGSSTIIIYFFNLFLNIKITVFSILSIFVIYSIPIIIIFLLSLYKFGLPKIKVMSIDFLKKMDKKYYLLLIILFFSCFLTFLPHILNNYYLPFHVDEWIHWSYSNALIKNGYTTFTNPYIGTREIASPEIGFHISTLIIKSISNVNIQSIFLFMPIVISFFISLTAFNIGERSKNKFGLEAAFIISFIPTTVRFLGPNFYVAVTFGILILIFIIWIAQIKEIQVAILFPILLFFTFIVHPATAFAGLVFIFAYSIFLLFEKTYKIAFWYCFLSVLPFFIILLFSTRWDLWIGYLIESIQGKEIISSLPSIWVDYNQMGLLTWGLFIIGVYFSFSKGKAHKKSLSFLSIIFIILIGLYDKLGYGFPIIYDRSFLYLFIPVSLIAAYALSEIKIYIKELKENKKFKHYKKQLKHLKKILPISISIVILIIGTNAHANTYYYEMINEDEYQDFIWIRDNIDKYRDENHSYDRAAIDPFKASPFSAITGLYIVSSNMHPTYSLKSSEKFKDFIKNECIDTNFLERYDISIIYGNCNNSNLTKIHNKVYLYPGLYE